MSPGNLPSFVYNHILIERYISSLSFKRKLLAYFFEKYRISREEYLDWYFKQVNNNNQLT